jgi:hypothetical protein
MSRFKVTDPCIVAGCSRQRKKDVPFCARCWAEADDGERVQVLFAIYAPYHGRSYIPADKTDADPGDGIDPMSVRTVQYGYLKIGGVSAHAILNEYEERTTLRATADRLKLRRFQRSEPAEPAFIEGEDQ